MEGRLICSRSRQRPAANARELLDQGAEQLRVQVAETPDLERPRGANGAKPAATPAEAVSARVSTSSS